MLISGLLGLYSGDLYLGGLYLGGLMFGGGAYIWNELSISICDGLIFRGAYITRGGGEAYSRGWGLIVGGFWYNDRENFTYIIRLSMGVLSITI